MKIKDKNVLVYGLASSGEWVARLLKKYKANVFLYDDDESVLKSKVLPNCYLVQELNENLISQFDFIVVSPAIEPDNPYLIMAENKNIRIFSELEFSSLFAHDLVAVTGTNGKTTTVELITAMLNKKYKAVACGNIGYPLSRAILENKHAIFVSEVSSFMLEHADSFSPHVATVLNIEPDHLIRHKTMEEYSRLKNSIFKNLTAKDFSVINLDFNIHNTTKSCAVTYSIKHMADVYLKEGYIFLHGKRLVAINELKLKGKHNIYNVMCAVCFAFIYKIPPKLIRDALIEYTPQRFRATYMGKINGINFINDSKSTNIASTLACVDSIKGAIILILCGSKKGLDYKKLFSHLTKRVRIIVVFGEISEDIVRENQGRFKIETALDLSSAFDYAVCQAFENDSIVFSPSSASYDQFSSYVERGRMFNKKVTEYEIESKKG